LTIRVFGGGGDDKQGVQ